jgi:DNA-binding Xre family transcriptional regulator
MEKPIGLIIRDVLDKSGMKLTAFAARIGTTRQNVYKIFEKESISTARLKRICEELEYDFFQHFRMVILDGNAHWPTPGEEIPVRPPRFQVTDLQKDLDSAEERIQLLEDRLGDKDEIIELLRAKLDKNDQ